MPKYYEISEATAKRAKDMNSYSDYAPGSATAGYRAMVDEAYALAEKQKAQVNPMYHDKIDALVDRYTRRLAENLNERNAIDARVPSILITGGGNFPVAKKAKQNAARDRNYGEYAEIEKLLDKIRSTGRGGISADDDLAVEKLTKKLEGMESQQATMKAVNAYYRKHKTLEGCPELTAEQVEKVKASMSQDWRKDPVPFPSYLLTNNNANIRRVRQRIEELSHKAEFVGWTFPGGEAKVNEAENRLQLIFEERPDADTRQALKSEGFKWAPSQGAWQRQLNQNAIRAAARLDFLRPEDGKSPYQLQPFAKRAEKDVSRRGGNVEKNQGYEIIKAVMLENGRGFALGYHPTAPSPYVTWACYDDKDGQRQYEWGHYGSDRAALEQDFAARVQEYQRLYNVGVKQSEAPGLYKYYSTQRPVDIGTFPKPPRNAPDEIVNYDQRVPVENGSFLAWGHLTYTRPLTKRQTSDYELRPAPDNPDRPRSIREQMKTAAKQAEADRGQSAPKKNAPDRGDR